jgi:hypothetical protein
VLHVGHIELIGGVQQLMRGNIRPTTLDRLDIESDRRGAEGDGTQLPLRNVSRLHRAVDLGGGFASVDEVHAEPGEFRAVLRFQRGPRCSLVFRQSPYAKRNARLKAVSGGVEWIVDGACVFRNGSAQTLLESRSAMEVDLRFCMRRINEGAKSYVSERRVLHVLALAEQLSAKITGPVDDCRKSLRPR